jgi:hypothetical protein
MDTIVAFFENTQQAAMAKSALSKMGVPESEISQYDGSTADTSGQREQTFWESPKHNLGWEETVRLRDEKVRVERRPAGGRVTSNAGAFDDAIVEETEIHEEPVVEKQARIVEEVTVHKDVREREATIRDTVRRADVKVEDEQAASNMPAGEDEYLHHWRTNYQSGQTPYEDYSMAYRFGATLPRGENWTRIEPDARRQWEQQRPRTWERFKDAVRFSWELGTSRRVA